ncbi:MAG TPA: peptide chain release factor N(5)-glutamine methyltransferase [Planctomycetota bacterium]|nr:peptide chain release factor N(5)-glutamine methyltransferase [Planctomycetota bacterium]
MNQLDEARRYLTDCGVDDPDINVKLIAAYCAGLPLKNALGAPPPTFTPGQEAKFRRFIARRGENREPVQYLVGSEEFMGLELKVTRATLIPRSSTEALVEKAGTPGRFLDVGTGSGAIAIALARTGARGKATDLSSAALDVARENARRHRVLGRITFVEADLFVNGRFDLIISNPPYIATSELAGLQPEVKHEPIQALHGGADGLDVIRRILQGARSRAPRLLMEIGSTQAAAARELALQAGWTNVQVTKDLDGHDRVLEAQ